MKKTILIATIFVFAIASAFTTKAFNVTGWANNSSGNPVSGTVDQANCAINLTTNCTMTVNDVFYSTVYDSKTNIGQNGKILKHN